MMALARSVDSKLWRAPVAAMLSFRRLRSEQEATAVSLLTQLAGPAHMIQKLVAHQVGTGGVGGGEEMRVIIFQSLSCEFCTIRVLIQ